MRIALVTDAWQPQVNGVVTTLRTTVSILRRWGHEVLLLTPEGFATLPCPSYPEIPLSLFPGRRVNRELEAFRPQAVHIATEGPLGFAARRYCVARGLPFTTAYHTRFPEYVRLRVPVPLSLSYRFMRWFHGGATRTFVATDTLRQDLTDWGFDHLVTWSRGVDVDLFHPQRREAPEVEGPVFLYVGRVAVEKNIKAFLDLDLPGSKMVVGGGPGLESLRRAYPKVHFTGPRFGEELARSYASADVFVFPSLTDTFGLVLIEAMASGLPVAAFPVTGPVDLIRQGVTGYTGDDLGACAIQALELGREAPRAFAEGFSWDACTRQFLDGLAPFDGVGEAVAMEQG
ncbi:glycosyltransferase family 4 protein [Endothiovibrio diazotrophicus]